MCGLAESPCIDPFSSEPYFAVAATDLERPYGIPGRKRDERSGPAGDVPRGLFPAIAPAGSTIVEPVRTGHKDAVCGGEDATLVIWAALDYPSAARDPAG